MNKSRAVSAISLAALFLVASFFRPSITKSAALTSVKDTMQTSRLSWSARIDSTGTTVGNSRVKIQSAPAVPYNGTSTANLRAGDTIYINANSYTVIDIVDGDEFTVSPVVASGDADNGDPIQLKQKARHVVTFTTASAVAAGYFRVLIPADATTPADGNVDDGGFDFGTGSIDVTASNVTGYTFVTGVATASGGTGCTSPANYHCFEIHYTGSGGIGTAITMNIGNTNGTNTLLNPTETASHTEGTADTYSFIVTNYDNNNVSIDTTTGKIAVIESVRVTATVDPTISFTIAGIDTGTSACGANPDVDTTTGTNAPLAVPFGTLTLNTFKDAAHNLTVSTNAAGGYVVTAAENDQLSKDGLGTTTIADTDCDGEDCTITSGTEWNTATDNGFGYSLQNVDAASISFQYNTGGTTFRAKPFAVLGTDTPETLFSSTTVADSQNAYICYRLSVGATQAAGDYENQITYTATATF